MVIDSVLCVERHSVHKTRLAIILNMFDMIVTLKKDALNTVQNEFYNHQNNQSHRSVQQHDFSPTLGSLSAIFQVSEMIYHSFIVIIL